MSAQKLVRLKAEIQSFQKNPSPGIHIYWDDENKLDEMKVQMTGPAESPYENSIFILKVSVPDRYPFVPPICSFLTKVYHPNIDDHGRICLQALKSKPTGSWAVTLNIITVLASIRVLLKEPNLSDPLMLEVAKEYSENYELYFNKAKNFAQAQAQEEG